MILLFYVCLLLNVSRFISVLFSNNTGKAESGAATAERPPETVPERAQEKNTLDSVKPGRVDHLKEQPTARTEKILCVFCYFRLNSTLKAGNQLA